MDVRVDFLGPPHGTTTKTLIIKVRSMQRSESEAIRTLIQPQNQNSVFYFNFLTIGGSQIVFFISMCCQSATVAVSEGFKSVFVNC